jgi:hypothetical protein
VETCFTPAEVALVAGLLGTLTATITVLFHMLLAAKDRELAATGDQRDQYRSVARKALLSLERAWRQQRTEAGLDAVRLPPPDPDLAPEDLQARLDAVAAALAHGGPDP